MKKIKKILLLLFLLVLAGSATAWYVRSGNTDTALFQTAKTTRGDLLVAINATGTLQPEEVVDVGARVAGEILSFGKDADGKTIDYGSTVEAGTVLARIDDSLYAADVEEAEAQVRSARASLKRAEADLVQLKAKLRQAERDWERARKLGPSEALSEASYGAYRSAFETAEAAVAVGEAAILQAKAGVSLAETGVRRAQRNLSYCTIKSPVRGVVIDRRVNIGQTVVASLNAPSLFLIAKDLTRMQVWVAVNEADIGRIRPGIPAMLTVDPFPDKAFRGEVSKVRLNASMTQNVVTYTVEIATENPNGTLLPYLTTNVQFELDRRSGVLTAPNTAFRWTPSPEQVAPAFREAFQSRSAGKAAQPGGARREAAASGSSGRGNRSVLWTPEGPYVRPVRVQTGLTDGTRTEVTGEGLTEGLEIVTGLAAPQVAGKQEVSNPFAPKLPSRGPGGRGR